MLKDQYFGIEIEMTGITKRHTAEIIADYFNSTYKHVGGAYDKYVVYEPDYEINNTHERKWSIVNDRSIKQQRKVYGITENIQDRDYSVELVSPICSYNDIETIQELIQRIRKEGGFCNDSTGIHIHINAEPFNADTLRNLVNIFYSKEDLIFKALQVKPNREIKHCKKVDIDFINKINTQKPSSLERVKSLWYNGEDRSYKHYDNTRYHALNLHSIFQKGTIEFRMFNSTMHTGKIKAYIQFCLAISSQALTQKRASFKKTISSNEKYTFRTWLLRLGMIGKEFETARLHLLRNLNGNIAWKDESQLLKQKERLAQRQIEQDQQNSLIEAISQNEENQELHM